MKTHKLLLVIAALALAALACSFDFDFPITTDIKTGPTVTDDVNIPYWGDETIPAEITLGFGAGDLFLGPGANDFVLAGDATYNVDDLKPEITVTNETISIKTGNLEMDGIPNFEEKVENTWDFKLGSMPIDLTIKAGAYKGEFELGSLSLTNLYVSDGAAQVYINFEQPNLSEMKTLQYQTGASEITLENLSNANFDTMIFESGAGKYELDFSGHLQKDANAFIESGLCTMTIIVPKTMNVKLSLKGGLTNISTRGNWDQSGSYYIIEGTGPLLTISVQMNAGNLILKNP